MQSYQEEVARREVYDTGKPIWEARIDVQTAIDAVEYYSGLAPTICGKFSIFDSRHFSYWIGWCLVPTLGLSKQKIQMCEFCA